MSKGTAVETTFVQKTLLLLCSVTLMLLIVCAAEFYCRWFTSINFGGISRGIFVARMFGDSYGNRPKYHGEAFGAEVQTDSNGFRIDPTFRGTTDSDDAVLILGDSVAFGVGVEASKTFAGLLQRAMPSVRFYNSSAIGYGLHDYLNVARQFIPARPEVKHVLLFYCLNDIYDTNAEEIVQDVNGTANKSSPFSSLHSFALSTNAYLRSRSKLYLYIKNLFTDPSARYFKQDLGEYQRRIDHVNDSLRPFRDIAKELSARGVSFEVFVMPYEAQLKTKQDADFLPQHILDAFLHQNEIAYYDAAGAFMQSSASPESLYLFGDPMHLSEAGHRLSFQFANAELTKGYATINKSPSNSFGSVSP